MGHRGESHYNDCYTIPHLIHGQLHNHPHSLKIQQSIWLAYRQGNSFLQYGWHWDQRGRDQPDAEGMFAELNT